jgi:hypothetical protein
MWFFIQLFFLYEMRATEMNSDEPLSIVASDFSLTLGELKT